MTTNVWVEQVSAFKYVKGLIQQPTYVSNVFNPFCDILESFQCFLKYKYVGQQSSWKPQKTSKLCIHWNKYKILETYSIETMFKET